MTSIVLSNFHSFRYTERMDRYCEEAFRLNVKLSLSELQRAINGDGRNDPNPLFKVSLNLDNDVLVFLPTLPQLTNVVASLGSKFTEIISVVPRLPDLLTRGRSSKSVRLLACYWSFPYQIVHAIK